MASEVIILSSDDEDDSWIVGKHQKRSKVAYEDADISVLEKFPSTETECISNHGSLADGKRSPGKGDSPQDDDCCILDQDPENSTVVPDFQANDADDIVVVGERGPCHCYVCDVLAPCLHWGLGMLSSDHCHAFDKDDKWRKLRTQVRSHSAKVSICSVPSDQDHLNHHHLLCAAQPPPRVFQTAGYKDSMYSVESTAVLHPFEQGTPNMNDLSAGWLPYLPSSWNNMQRNGPNVIRPSAERYAQSTGNCQSVPNRTSCRRRGFSEHRGLVANNVRETVTLQQRNHHLLVNSNGIVLGESNPTLQRGSCPPTHAASSAHCYHNRRAVYSAVPHNYIEDHGRPTWRVSGRPPISSSLPYDHFKDLERPTRRAAGRPSICLPDFSKDLALLQSYLMEGVSEQPRRQFTPPRSVVVDSGCAQLAGTSPRAESRERDLLYNPFQPSVMPATDDVGPRRVSSQPDNRQTNIQLSKDAGGVAIEVPGNQNNTEQGLSKENGNDGSSILDQILAGFDDDFWTAIETTASGF
ncbi:hypothetical protein KP509_12G026900 [Ceratopteris richardii]|uniref:Uncharacterized protein n=1 Tax=Ceratopteris richardii TaxID=49495 RepID=A0A8T2TLY7_CERRI|nr:hypothetical protein KP509_12G026900 [Ceratopteris richardii]